MTENKYYVMVTLTFQEVYILECSSEEEAKQKAILNFQNELETKTLKDFQDRDEIDIYCHKQSPMQST